jgi:hypothetical protein
MRVRLASSIRFHPPYAPHPLPQTPCPACSLPISFLGRVPSLIVHSLPVVVPRACWSQGLQWTRYPIVGTIPKTAISCMTSRSTVWARQAGIRHVGAAPRSVMLLGVTILAEGHDAHSSYQDQGNNTKPAQHKAAERPVRCWFAK